jgi:D-sedoheptulose 7-phosphate isomerase
VKGRSDLTYFPGKKYESIASYLDEYFDQQRLAAASVSREQMAAAAELIVETVARDGTIFSCGNGGSAAIANHLACDCLKGVRTDTTIRPRVASLAATIELITAIANDISFDEIFSFQLSSMARRGDVLIAISSSGESRNIVNALSWARHNGIRTIALTGFMGGKAADLAEVHLHVDAHNYGIVEDIHQSLMHTLAQYVRHRHLADGHVLGQKKF